MDDADMRKTRVLVLSVFIGFTLMAGGWKLSHISKEQEKRGPLFSLLKRISREMIKQDSAKVQPAPFEKVNAEKDVFVARRNSEDKIQSEPLALELLGTAIGEADIPRAFIRDLKTNKQGTYRSGDSISQARVVEISRGEVVLERNGKKEILKLMTGSGWAGIFAKITQFDGSMLIDRNALLNEVQNFYKTIDNVKFEPHYEANEVVGVMINGIDEGGIFELAEIQNNDVITAVNGQKINSYQKAMQVFKKAKNQAEIRASLLRDGRAKMLNYRIR